MSSSKATPSTPLALRARIYGQVEEERERQDQKYGGPSHDDEHDPHEWCHFLRLHVEKAHRAVSGDVYRNQLIRVIALAVAAVEVYDRKVVK